MDQKESPILVFDSGMGGISVLREIVRLMPDEHYIYFGDSANAPYGPRTTQEIRALTLEHIARLKREYDFKCAVIACNTATSAAAPYLRETYPQVPIIGGDRKSVSIAAASIVAKVTRDRMMVEYDEMFPGYAFAKNKGYGTAEHIAALKELGPCPIHRRTFITKFVPDDRL